MFIVSPASENHGSGVPALAIDVPDFRVCRVVHRRYELPRLHKGFLARLKPCQAERGQFVMQPQEMACPPQAGHFSQSQPG